MSNRPNTRAQKPAAPPPQRSLLWPILIGVIVLAGIAAIAITALSGSDDDTASGGGGGATPEAPDPRELDSVSVSGTALAAFESSAADPAVGETAPVLEGVDMYGEPMTIGGPGEPTVVMFLAHWCPHCQREVPIVTDWVEAGGVPEGAQLVAVSTSFDEGRGNWPPADWLEEEGWTVPTMVDPSEEAAETWGLSGFPYFVAIDANGEVVARASGEIPMEQLDAMFAAAMAGGTTPTRADPA